MPDEWPVVRLRFRVEINPTKSEVDGWPGDSEVSFVPMEAVGEYGGLRLDQTKPLVEVSSGYTFFRDGDVVVAKITPCFENGKGAIAEGLENGIGFGTTELHVLRPSAELDCRFLFYLTMSHAFRNIGAAYMYGAGGQKRVPDDFVRDFRNPIPPIQVQRAIAAFLDRETGRIDALIEKKERQIELLQEKRAALITHAVTKGLDPNVRLMETGISWASKVPQHWRIVRLRRVGVVDQGCSFPDAIQGKAEGEIPWYKVDDMNRQGNEESMVDSGNYVGSDVARDARAAVFPAGTVIFPRVGAALLTNKRRLLSRPSIVDDNIYGFVSQAVDSKFVYYVLSLVDLASVCSPGLVPTVTIPAVKDLRIPLPPSGEQKLIVTYLDQVRLSVSRALGKVEASVNLLKEYRSALISAAVTGKIDVRGKSIRG